MFADHDHKRFASEPLCSAFSDDPVLASVIAEVIERLPSRAAAIA